MKKEVALPPYDGKMGVFNYMRKNNLNTSEEMFLKLNNLSPLLKATYLTAILYLVKEKYF